MIVAGFGCRQGATLASLENALELASGQVPAVRIAMLAAPEDKCGLVAELAARLGLPVLGIAPHALEAAATVTRSAASLAARRTGSVAEASALAAIGAPSRLIVPRIVSSDRMATCAIAEGALS
ncbi:MULTISPECIES: cobalamin biosynthesis protein [Sphingomonadaceae]|uniref:cobalamin biosynthesis protein n=1 Tax=Sphingomonadaceae TaxID=41297 RepID=UPI00115A9B10|nr:MULTISPECIES: cobalamin biosynthesis protein [Sphingomonadaceae]QDK35272.1 precorrin methylase [Sphingomonas sp. IC081]QSR19779.1 precorrin methylase [Novosphingobium sp. KA1]